MSGPRGQAVILLSRWRRVVDNVARVTTLDPADPELAAIFSELVELSDETDRFLDDATEGQEVTT